MPSQQPQQSAPTTATTRTSNLHDAASLPKPEHLSTTTPPPRSRFFNAQGFRLTELQARCLRTALDDRGPQTTTSERRYRCYCRIRRRWSEVTIYAAVIARPRGESADCEIKGTYTPDLFFSCLPLPLHYILIFNLFGTFLIPTPFSPHSYPYSYPYSYPILILLLSYSYPYPYLLCWTLEVYGKVLGLRSTLVLGNYRRLSIGAVECRLVERLYLLGFRRTTDTHGQADFRPQLGSKHASKRTTCLVRLLLE